MFRALAVKMKSCKTAKPFMQLLLFEQLNYRKYANTFVLFITKTKMSRV